MHSLVVVTTMHTGLIHTQPRMQPTTRWQTTTGGRIWEKRFPLPVRPPTPIRLGGGGGRVGGDEGAWKDGKRTGRMGDSLRKDMDEMGKSCGRACGGTCGGSNAAKSWNKLGPIPCDQLYENTTPASHESKSTENKKPNKTKTRSAAHNSKSVQGVNDEAENVDEAENDGDEEEGNTEESESESEKGSEKVRDERAQGQSVNEADNVSLRKDESLSANKDLNARLHARMNERLMSQGPDANTNVESVATTHSAVQADNAHTGNTASNKKGETDEADIDIYVDAIEPNDETNDEPEIVDEYIEVKTPGVKHLEAITPKPRPRRKKERRKPADDSSTGTGTKESPVRFDSSYQFKAPSNTNKEIVNETEALANSTSQQATTPTSEESNQSGLAQDQTDPPNPAQVAQSTVGKSGDNGDDITAANTQSVSSLQSQIQRVNELAAAREAREATDSHTTDITTPQLATGGKQTQAKLTFGGAIRRPNVEEEESEMSESSKGAKGGGGKKKPKKQKKSSKKDSSNSSNSTERKLRSQSSTQ